MAKKAAKARPAPQATKAAATKSQAVKTKAAKPKPTKAPTAKPKATKTKQAAKLIAPTASPDVNQALQDLAAHLATNATWPSDPKEFAAQLDDAWFSEIPFVQDELGIDEIDSGLIALLETYLRKELGTPAIAIDDTQLITLLTPAFKTFIARSGDFITDTETARVAFDEYRIQALTRDLKKAASAETFPALRKRVMAFEAEQVLEKAFVEVWKKG